MTPLAKQPWDLGHLLLLNFPLLTKQGAPEAIGIAMKRLPVRSALMKHMSHPAAVSQVAKQQHGTFMGVYRRSRHWSAGAPKPALLLHSLAEL